MKKSLLMSVICAAFLSLIAAPVLFAADAPGDDYIIAAPEGMKSKKDKLQKTVPFPHSKHGAYECVECHHTLEADGEVQKCTSAGCHDSLEFRSKENAKDVKLVENAFHGQCISCHKALKKEKKPTGPTACGKCHTN